MDSPLSSTPPSPTTSPTTGLQRVSPQSSPKSPTPHNTTVVNEAIVNYYKLKGAYDKKYANTKKKIMKSGLSNSAIRRKLNNMQKKCINCKQNGGTIFTNKNRILTAKCGNTVTPCSLDLQIKLGKWMLFSEAIKITTDSIDDIKASIINLKLDLLFGLRTEEQITEQFDEDKTQYKTLLKQLNLLTNIIESENEVSIDGLFPDQSERKIPLSQYMKIKNLELKQLVSQFKELIKEYTEEEEQNQKQDLMQQAINIYIEQIFPLMTQIRESKYAITTVHKEGDLFILTQIKTLLQNLDFEYEFGEIISDKK